MLRMSLETRRLRWVVFHSYNSIWRLGCITGKFVRSQIAGTSFGSLLSTAVNGFAYPTGVRPVRISVRMLAALPLLGLLALTLVSCGGPGASQSAEAAIPSITTQPVSQTVRVGQTATFVVAATGAAPLSYPWQKNGVNIAGATATSYTTPATTTSDSGSSFDVVVSNTAGTVTSSAATLTVNPAPVAPTFCGRPRRKTLPASQ